jgi:hypothetical protein
LTIDPVRGRQAVGVPFEEIGGVVAEEFHGVATLA